jgi:hypothetical protein
MSPMANINANQLIELITNEDIVTILEDLGADKIRENSREIVFTSICHNSTSPKLYFYKQTRTFYCYICNHSGDLFGLISEVLSIEFKDSFKYVCDFKGIKNTHFKKIGFNKTYSNNNELEFLRLHSYKPNKSHIELPKYNVKVLNNFACLIHESWYKEGIIDDETLEQFKIRFDVENSYQLIPYRSENGECLNGIVRRSFCDEEIERTGKYFPYSFGDITYKFNKGLVLYGYYENKENIDRIRKCILFESEKSVLLYSCYKGVKNGIALALGGMNLSKIQVDLLLKRNIEEICIALDKQIQVDLIDKEDNSEEIIKAKKEMNLYVDKIKKIYKLLHNYFNVTIILDWSKGEDRLLSYKDSPIDKGEQVFDKLYKERYTINSLEELEELYLLKENGEKY